MKIKPLYFLSIIAGVILLAYALRGQSSAPSAITRLEAQFPALGTQANLLVELPAARTKIFAAATDEIKSRLQHLENLMSRFRDDSDVSKFNSANVNEWVAVDPLTWRALTEARRINELSRGAFDITILPLLKLYDFRNAETVVFPDQKTLAETRTRIGMDKIQWRRDGMLIAKTVAGVEIDLGGVAKGLAVDIAAAALQEFGVENAIVDIGGEQIILGNPDRAASPKTLEIGADENAEKTETETAGWTTGIRDPRRRDEIARVLQIKQNCALATSGDYEKFFIRDGKRYSHIIDPHSGLPVTGGIISATIITPDNCALADALATAVSVLNIDRNDERRGDIDANDKNSATDFTSQKKAKFNATDLLEIFPQVEAWLICDDGEVIHIPRREIKIKN